MVPSSNNMSLLGRRAQSGGHEPERPVARSFGPATFSIKIFRCLYRRCPPLPIPNREVKPARADGTAVTRGRVGRRRSLRPPFRYGGGLFLCPAVPLREGHRGLNLVLVSYIGEPRWSLPIGSDIKADFLFLALGFCLIYNSILLILVC